MKKLYFIFIFALIFCLVGCNVPNEQGDDEVNNTQIEENNNAGSEENDLAGSDDDEDMEPISIEVSEKDPEPQVVVVPSEKDKLADLYVKELYNMILLPNAVADENDVFHSESAVTVSDLTVAEIKVLLYHIDYNFHIYSGEGTDFSFYYELDDMQATAERVFGAGVEIDTAEWQAGGKYFMYEERMRRFGGEPAFGGDRATSKIVGFFGEYEIDGDNLYVYDRVLYCTHDRENTGIIKFYSDINKTEDSFVNEMKVGSYLPEDFSNDEALAENGVKYKHTFKLAADGESYYWVSSEPVK